MTATGIIQSIQSRLTNYTNMVVTMKQTIEKLEVNILDCTNIVIIGKVSAFEIFISYASFYNVNITFIMKKLPRLYASF